MATIRKRGNLQWQAIIRRKGRVLSKTFFSKADAEMWSRKIESEIDRGIHINTNEAERLSLSNLIERYEDEYLPTLKSQRQERSRLKIIRQELGKSMLATVTSSEILKYRNKRLKFIKENSVNREITTLKRLMSFAANECKITLPFGVPQIKPIPIDDSRERRVTDAEIEAICAVTRSKELPKIIALALMTAMRRSEISGLMRKNVDFMIPSAKLIDTKNGKNRVAPLMPRAANLIQLMPLRFDGYVFSLKPDSISQSFERAVMRARKAYEQDCANNKVEPDQNFLINLRFHDLRHEATSRLASLLPNVIELSRVTGHTDLKMLSRYYQISVSELAKKLA